MRIKLIVFAAVIFTGSYLALNSVFFTAPLKKNDKADSPTEPLALPAPVSSVPKTASEMESTRPDIGGQRPDSLEDPGPDRESQVINIGEYIDVDALPVYGDREPINIGEYIDVDALPPDDGRPPINIGDPLPAPDDPDYVPQSYAQPINIGDYLPPPDEYDPGIYGEYTEPVNIGEPIYIDEPL